MRKPVSERKQSCLNSFEPGVIIEAEERERTVAMAQREFMMKCFGITEQVRIFFIISLYIFHSFSVEY